MAYCKIYVLMDVNQVNNFSQHFGYFTWRLLRLDFINTISFFQGNQYPAAYYKKYTSQR